MLFHGNQKKFQSLFHRQVVSTNGTEIYKYNIIGTTVPNNDVKILAP